MKEELVILDEDKTYAQARIAELDKQIQELGPEFYEVFNQSSETWHDNAPFDALRDRQSVLDAERQQLKRLLQASSLGIPKPKRGIAGIGSIVTLSSGTTYHIAGDWTPHAGQIKNGATVVSCKTPLARALINKKVGDNVAIGRQIVTIAGVI